MNQDTAIFIVRCAQQQAQSLTEMLAGALMLLEEQPQEQKIKPCQHPMKSRLDLSTFNRTKWTCRECGSSVDEELPPKPVAPPLMNHKEGEIPERHPMAGNFS